MARGYNTTSIPLDVAGQQRLSQESGYFLFMDAVNASGVQQLDAFVEIAFGAYPGEWLPFRLNNQVEGYFGDVTLRWPAQPGWTAKFYQSRGNKADYDLMPLKLYAPPTKQLVTSGLASNFATDLVTVTTLATQIVPARSTRQGLTVTNEGGGTVFIGSAGVTAAGAGRGLRLAPNAVFSTTECTAALYGICATGSNAVNFLEEY